MAKKSPNIQGLLRSDGIIEYQMPLQYRTPAPRKLTGVADGQPYAYDQNADPYAPPKETTTDEGIKLTNDFEAFQDHNGKYFATFVEIQESK